MAPTETCRSRVGAALSGAVSTDMEGWVHSIETMGTADGPGAMITSAARLVGLASPADGADSMATTSRSPPAWQTA